MELTEIKKALADRAEEVCRHLLPGGKIDRQEWVCGDMAGSAGSSLKIVMSGDKAGIFRDFAADTGGSNLLELWVQVKGLPFLSALTEAKEWLALHGVKEKGADLRLLRKKEYSKPSIAGITWIASRAEVYLMTERMLPKATLDLYKISMTDDGNAIVFPYLNEITAKAEMIKFVNLERDEKGKKVSWTSKDTAKVLFGKHTRRPEDRYLLISEGEIDAMSWQSRKIPGLCCTSVPFGAKWESEKTGQDPNSEWIENDWDFIHSFERIYLSADMDDEGRKMQNSLVKRLGREVCFIVALPTKDANELLKAGRDIELDVAFDKARTQDPETLKNMSHFRDAILDRMYAGDLEAKRGIPLHFGNYPWHVRWNEWTAVTGQNGSGKTILLGNILLNLKKKGYKCCVASLEVPGSQTGEFWVRQASGKKLPPRAEAERVLDWIEEGFWMFDKVGKARWQDVLAAFRYAYRRYGCRLFVIDSWMKMGIAPDDLELQGEVCNAMSDFVSECDVHLFVVAHPRKVQDEKTVVGKMDVKGSGELTDQAHNVWVVWRNKAKEAEITKDRKLKEDEAKIIVKQRTKPDGALIVVKQRNDDGEEPTIDLWYDLMSKQYSGWYVGHGESLLPPLVAPPPPGANVVAPPRVAEPDDDENVPF